MLFATVVLSLLSAVSAIMVTAPTNSSGWSSSGSETITWSYVDTDPTMISIELITPANPNSPVTIANNVSTSDGSYTYTPSSSLAVGDNYRVNIVGATTQNTGILAQSDYFSVTSGTSTVSGSSSMSSSMSSSTTSSASTSSTSSAMLLTTSGSSPVSTAASASSSAASASASKSAGDRVVVAPALLAGAGLLAFFF